MPATLRRLRCPKCGAEMNRHAEKLVYSDYSPGTSADPSLGGVIAETHACPRCGNVEARVT